MKRRSMALLVVPLFVVMVTLMGTPFVTTAEAAKCKDALCCFDRLQACYDQGGNETCGPSYEVCVGNL